MSITKCLASHNSIAISNLHETLTQRTPINLPFNPTSNFPITKHPLTTRWNSMIVYANVEPAGTPPPPPGSPSNSWKNWVIGILMTFIVPLVTTKGGPIKLLLQKADEIMDEAEHITEMVEEVAEKVDKVVEELEDSLPENSKIKKTLDYIELVAEKVDKDAHTAADFLDKVHEMEDKIEDLMGPVLEEAKEVANEAKGKKQ